MLPRVKEVHARAGHKLELAFTSGEVGVYDCSPLLDFGVFGELQDEAYFRQVQVVNGTVAYPIDVIYVATDGTVVALERAVAGGDDTARCHDRTRDVIEVPGDAASAVVVGDALVR